MKCQNCGKNEVNVHLRQNINGQVSEYALCSECAEKLGVGGMFADFGSFGGFGGINLLGGMDPFAGFESLLGNMLSGGAVKSLPRTQRCGLCGSSFDDIARRGKAGCAECYEQFADRLNPSIERLHNRTRHIGKMPGRPSAAGSEKVQSDEKPAAASAPVETVDTLRTQLREAVAREDYERAAILRDRIKEMENK